MEVHSCERNSSIFSSNYENVYVGSTKGHFKKAYYIHRNSFAHKIYRYRTSLSNYVWEIKNNLGTDSILRWEIVKKNVANIRQVINSANYVWRRN